MGGGERMMVEREDRKEGGRGEGGRGGRREGGERFEVRLQRQEVKTMTPVRGRGWCRKVGRFAHLPARLEHDGQSITHSCTEHYGPRVDCTVELIPPDPTYTCIQQW